MLSRRLLIRLELIWLLTWLILQGLSQRVFILHQFLTQETAHMLVADLGQQRRTQAQTRGARRHIGGRAADVFLKTAHVLQTATDLRAIKVNGRAPDGDEVQILGHYTVPPSEPSSWAIS